MRYAVDMFWADRIAGEVEARFGKNPGRPLIVRDEKTASGRVHVGSMRGVMIHGTVSQALKDRGIDNTFLYEINDTDPMDGFPVYLPEEFKQYMGFPLFRIPSPDGIAKNFADYFATEFKQVIESSGFTPTFYNVSELYLSGKMDESIREALTHAGEIRRIYLEVSGSQKPENWYPLSVICENCGKVGTTKVTSFDGTYVTYVCDPHAVEWAQGCSHTGKVSPYGGNATLPFKVEWPAKWKVVGVDIEGGGKDHSTRGGTRDVGGHIAREVFRYEPPFDVPYEFFLVGGKKMSSSKGRGSSAREIADLLPPKIFRLAILSKDINQAINFDPEGDTIPVLYDLYDKLAQGFATTKDDDYARLFTLAHAGVVPPSGFLPRFSQVAFIIQMPHMQLKKEMAALKGSPLTDAENAEVEERAVYAKRWLDLYAPEKFVFKLQESLPEAAKNLNDVQKKALGMLAEYIQESEAMPSGEDVHHFLHGLKDSVPIAPGELFKAIYLVFLAKESGPKAGWFLSSLNKELVLKLLGEAA